MHIFMSIVPGLDRDIIPKTFIGELRVVSQINIKLFELNFFPCNCYKLREMFRECQK